jgi:hypothetical protein
MYARLGLFGLVLSACAVSGAHAAMQMPSTGAVLTVERAATEVTFWAQPYPDRYAPRHRCPRVRVETPYGWYWDHVCMMPGTPVLRRSY